MAGPQEVPPASFPMLVSMLATQAAMALGQLENPVTKKKEINLDFAKRLIDTLGVLETKTQGNLTNEEAAVLTAVLTELRFGFVAAKSGG